MDGERGVDVWVTVTTPGAQVVQWGGLVMYVRSKDDDDEGFVDLFHYTDDPTRVMTPRTEYGKRKTREFREFIKEQVLARNGANVGPIKGKRSCKIEFEKEFAFLGMKSLEHVCATDPLERLENLDLSGSQIGDKGLKILASVISPSGKQAMKNLEALDVRHNNIGYDGIEAFLKACVEGALASLKRLNLDNNIIRTDGVQVFAEALQGGALAALTELHLQENNIDEIGVVALAGAIEVLSHLNSLLLGNNGIGSGGMTALAARSGVVLKKMMLLDLNNSNIDDDAMKAFSNASLPNLEYLYMNDNAIGDSGLKILSRASLHGLSSLRLDNNLLTNAGMEAFWNACCHSVLGRVAFERLRVLRLDNNNIGDEGLRMCRTEGKRNIDTMVAHILPNLSTLGLLGNDAITSDGVSYLAEAITAGAMKHLKNLYLEKLHYPAFESTKELHMGANGLTSTHMTIIAHLLTNGAFPFATLLDLSSNPIGDEGLMSLANAISVRFSSNWEVLLTELNLRATGIGDLGMQALSSTWKLMRRLEKLDLADNNINDGGMTAFSDACTQGTLQNLVELDLSGNPISPQMLGEFGGRLQEPSFLPNLQTLNGGQRGSMTFRDSERGSVTFRDPERE